MGSHFVQGVTLETETCCKCGMVWAMTADFVRRRRDDNAWFYCPAGHQQHYTANQLDKLRQELNQAHRDIDRAKEAEAEQRAKVMQIAKSYNKVRQRIRNGVCPCCNRTFQNLANHMRTEHADYGDTKTLRALRVAFGLTQAQLAAEAGVSAPYVSLFERGTDLPKWAENRLNEWVEKQKASA